MAVACVACIAVRVALERLAEGFVAGQTAGLNPFKNRRLWPAWLIEAAGETDGCGLHGLQVPAGRSCRGGFGAFEGGQTARVQSLDLRDRSLESPLLRAKPRWMHKHRPVRRLRLRDKSFDAGRGFRFCAESWFEAIIWAMSL
eukprot:s15_g9.t1